MADEMTSPPTTEAPAVADMPSEVSGPAGITPESVIEFLKANPDALPEERIYEIPSLRSRIDRTISKRDVELKRDYETRMQREAQERQAKEAQRLEDYRIVNQIEKPDSYGLSSEQIRQAITANPRLGEQYAQAKARMTGSDPVVEQQILDRVWEKARTHLEGKYEVELKDADSLERVIEMATDAQIGKERGKLESLMEDRFKAFQSELYGKLNLNADQPERGTGTGVAGGKRTWTVGEIDKLSVLEWRKNEEDIMAAHREGRIR